MATLDLQSLKTFLLSIDGVDECVEDHHQQYTTLRDLVGNSETMSKITCDGKVFFVEYNDVREWGDPRYYITPEHNIPSYTL